MKRRWCWRCKKEVPVLDEAETAFVWQREIGEEHYLRDRQVAMAQQKRHWLERTRQRYHELTGEREENTDVIHHHTAAYFGPDCAACGKPLRSPQARFCAACGHRPPT